ncbi:MAG: hypothetical protein ACFFCF_03635 [Promethearchaeota archaeon]
MTRKWYSIAKAEYLISTSSLRDHRTKTLGALFIFGLLWAILIAPITIGIIINSVIPLVYFQPLLFTFLPGILRSVMFFLWIILLIIPLSRALQEMRIGQWEILLSNDVKTRDILTGTFLGKIPLYGLLVMYIAPPLLAILFLAFEVILLGQVLIYLVLFGMILSTIWLSNFITAAIQAKLGESAHGKELANGLAILLAIVSIIPIYGIMFFSQQMSVILGLNVFLLLPFTWPADMISWLTLIFSQITLTPAYWGSVLQILQLDLVISTALFAIFGLACIITGLLTADRIFTYNIGARTEQISTVKGENAFYRGIRKLLSGSFGALVVISLKDFLRKASNLARIAYGIILAVALPLVLMQVMIGIGDAEGFDFMMLVMVTGIGMALIGSFTFGGTAFMESKDQLWIIQSTPSGTSRYVKARIISAFLIALPLCIIPAVVITFLAAADLQTFVFFLGYGYLVICGAIVFSTGVTAWNPHYENTKSPEHQMNVIITTMGVQFLLFAPIMISLISDLLGFHFWDLLITTIGSAGLPFAFALIGLLALALVGSVTLILGVKRLAQPEV